MLVTAAGPPIPVDRRKDDDVRFPCLTEPRDSRIMCNDPGQGHQPAAKGTICLDLDQSAIVPLGGATS